MGRADFGGVLQDVCLEYTPDIHVGDYAIVHVGFAIAKLNVEQATETLSLIQSIPLIQPNESPIG